MEIWGKSKYQFMSNTEYMIRLRNLYFFRRGGGWLAGVDLYLFIFRLSSFTVNILL